MKRAQAEKRDARRRLVGFPVECMMGGLVASGLVRDITLGGAFIASSHGRDLGGFQAPSETAFNKLLQVGDQFLLTFTKTSVMNEHSVLATVCWQGISAEHGCHGYGAQYNTARQLQVAQNPTRTQSAAHLELSL
jgi:hypothetical protein